MKKISHRQKLFYLVALQLLFLLSLAGTYYTIDWFGEEITLKTAPVDPTDLFRGDYVVLNYEISTIDLAKAEEKDLPPGTPVYVVLEKKGRYYEAVALNTRKPDLKAGQKMMIGKIGYWWDQAYRVTYGIEAYYVPENRGKEIEEKREQMDVVVKVTSAGRAKVDRLLYKGEPLRF